jgi:hypothetical protein
MNYDGLEVEVSQLIDQASEERLRAFGADTVTRLVRNDTQWGLVDRAALDPGAWMALEDACRHIRTASGAELRGHLRRIDEGVLTDGDMDFPLLNILDAIDQWTTFLETGTRDALRELALRAIDQVDFQFEADLSDVLATPEMAAELDRIKRLLNG